MRIFILINFLLLGAIPICASEVPLPDANILNAKFVVLERTSRLLDRGSIMLDFVDREHSGDFRLIFSPPKNADGSIPSIWFQAAKNDIGRGTLVEEGTILNSKIVAILKRSENFQENGVSLANLQAAIHTLEMRPADWFQVKSKFTFDSPWSSEAK